MSNALFVFTRTCKKRTQNESFVTIWEIINNLEYISTCETGSACVFVFEGEKSRVLTIFIEKEHFFVMLGPRRCRLFDTSSPTLENSHRLDKVSFFLTVP